MVILKAGVEEARALVRQEQGWYPAYRAEMRFASERHSSSPAECTWLTGRSYSSDKKRDASAPSAARSSAAAPAGAGPTAPPLLLPPLRSPSTLPSS